MTIGKIVKEYRQRNGLAQWQFGEKAGLRQGVISKAEQTPGYSPTVDNLIKFAKGLDMTVEELIREMERYK